MQKPSLGRMVIVPMDPAANNGATEAPAIVTRVWSDTCVNVSILVDSHSKVEARTSVALYETAETAAAVPGSHRAWWPPRV